MFQIHLQQIDVNGCRLVGAITMDLGFDGPTHHAIVLGRSPLDGHIYLAELMHSGYQITTYADFYGRYSANGAILIQPNDGPTHGVHVAQRALAELGAGGAAYDLLTNN